MMEPTHWQNNPWLVAAVVYLMIGWLIMLRYCLDADAGKPYTEKEDWGWFLVLAVQLIFGWGFLAAFIALCLIIPPLGRKFGV